MKIQDYIGHTVEAEMTLDGYFGKTDIKKEGKIIYSGYNASLFFKPKHSRNKGYLINDEENIHNVRIIRKNNKDNKMYWEAYQRAEEFEREYKIRTEQEADERARMQEERKKHFEEERRRKEEQKQQEINEARDLGGYEQLEKDVINFYNSFDGEFFNENFVKTVITPLLNKLVHKSIENVNEYPKYFFGKNSQPKFCALLEKKLNIKLPKTQKGSVAALNEYLSA